VTGFTALPAGRRSGDNGAFNSIGTDCFWWSATEVSSTVVFIQNIYYNDEFTYRGTDYKKPGFSVRCVNN
jgi:uncharacterized protein (TIGR02145 family)